MTAEIDLDDEIKLRQLSLFASIKMRSARLREILSVLDAKIDSEGVRGYYSSNHDLLDIAQGIHRNIAELCILRGWRWRLDSSGQDVQKATHGGIMEAPKEVSWESSESSSQLSGSSSPSLVDS